MTLEFEVIEQKVLVDATPVEVFEAYANMDKHARFTRTKASGTSKVGGEFTAGDGYISGKFLVLERGSRIVHEWKTTEWPPGYPWSVVELTFRPRGDRTELTMVHSKVPAEQAEYYARGWKEFYWEPLRAFFGPTPTRRKKTRV